MEINKSEHANIELAPQMVQIRLFHEMLLKGGNRKMFVRRFRENLNIALRGLRIRKIMQRPMMFLLELEEEASWEELKARLTNVIGIEKFARVWRVPPDLCSVKNVLNQIIPTLNPSSFRITARRSDKTFALTSPEINQALGTYVHEQFKVPVDLDKPDLNVRVQITEKEALVSLMDHEGPRGMPVGVAGKVTVLLSGGIDSPVASYQMMERGCEILFVHFHSFPLVDGTSREKVDEIVRMLTRYQYRSRLLLVPFARLQQEVILTVPPQYRIIVYRRLMFKIAQTLALQSKSDALVTGESLGQVSSQTLRNLSTISAVLDKLPVLRPLIAADKETIVKQAKSLGTYTTSIIPDQDCCTLFVPKHPVTSSRLREIEQIESGLDLDKSLQETFASIEEKTYHWPL